MKNCIGIALLLALLAPFAATAEIMDRPGGIKIGQRMTLRPYVSFSATYDSNVMSSHDDEEGDCMWTISPVIGLTYDADDWSLLLNAYYNYHAYCRNVTKDQSGHTFGEDLRWNWSNSKGADKGWTLMLSESFNQISMADDMTLSDGRGYTSDSRQFQFAGALQRRITEQWHGDLNASYSWLDYLNDTSDYGSYYGWQRWTVGLQTGYALTQWTDFLLSGSYNGYIQDNTCQTDSYGISDDSVGYSVQAGLGSYMTERISYRLLAGYSGFDYGKTGTDGGFVYTVSGNWKIGETWNTMLVASSYYQPSERQSASKSRNDSISWGLAKSMVRGKLRGTLDVMYNRSTNEYEGNATGDLDYTTDVLTARLGFDYTLNRFLAFFIYGEYQKSWNDHSDSRMGAYDYDRWRITGGLRLQY